MADFLTFMFEDKKCAVSTLRGYRSVILNTLRDQANADFRDDIFLRNLLSNFAVERPRSLRSLPQWDLSLVMSRLTRAPFEPLRSTTMQALSWKTAFLVALASAKRRSELRAFSYKVLHPENWSSVTLRPLASFVAKTEVPGKPETRLQDVTLQGLGNFCSNSLSEERTLCPVRAVKIYLSRTKEVRGQRQELFIPYKLGATQSISPVSISNWIQRAVKAAYTDASEEEAAAISVRAHDLRGIAASWNLHQSIPIGDILRAAQWRCHNTFTSFYLKDMTLQEDDILRLGPISVGQVLHRPTSSP